jgi:hypothetical protein
MTDTNADSAILFDVIDRRIERRLKHGHFFRNAGDWAPVWTAAPQSTRAVAALASLLQPAPARCSPGTGRLIYLSGYTGR